MGWGETFTSAYQAASEVAKAAADKSMSSASAAVEAVARMSAAAARSAIEAATAAKSATAAGAAATRDAVVAGAAAARDAAVAGATAARDAAVAGAKAVQQGAAATARGAGNVASFGARAAGEVVIAGANVAASAAAAPYRAAKQLFSPTEAPERTMIEPCPGTWRAKKARLEKRRQLIDEGRRSPDPAERAAAERLAQNNESVELARLSADSYDMSPSPLPGHVPPPGWSAVPDAELEALGISPQALADSRAVVYRSAPDWPGGQKTVLAFRGTADLEDGIVDHDQAMALETKQYEAAMLVGRQVGKGLGPNVLVTGHSLGGGKAQAAGAVSGLGGTMFNSAGLNPSTVDGMMPAADQFKQVRTTGDPLTGVQNSAALQTVVAAAAGVGMAGGAAVKAGDWVGKQMGLAGFGPEAMDYADKATKALPRGIRNLVADGNVLPPAIGPVQTVRALDDDGQPIALTNALGQHSMKNAINGIEEQKMQDLATLQGDG